MTVGLLLVRSKGRPPSGFRRFVVWLGVTSALAFVLREAGVPLADWLAFLPAIVAAQMGVVRAWREQQALQEEKRALLLAAADRGGAQSRKM